MLFCLIVFFPDRKKHSTGDSGSVIYTSETLAKLWPFGFASIGDVTFESAAYCSRYIMKKVTGDLAESHYETVDFFYWRSLCACS